MRFRERLLEMSRIRLVSVCIHRLQQIPHGHAVLPGRLGERFDCERAVSAVCEPGGLNFVGVGQELCPRRVPLLAVVLRADLGNALEKLLKIADHDLRAAVDRSRETPVREGKILRLRRPRARHDGENGTEER